MRLAFSKEKFLETADPDLIKILLLLIMSFFLVGCATPTKTTVTMENGEVVVFEDYNENSIHHWNGDLTLYLTNGGKVHIPSGSIVEVEKLEESE